MNKWLVMSALVLGVLAGASDVNAGQTYTPYRTNNDPISRFYDPAPALTGGYYDKSCRPSITTQVAQPAAKPAQPNNMKK